MIKFEENEMILVGFRGELTDAAIIKASELHSHLCKEIAGSSILVEDAVVDSLMKDIEDPDQWIIENSCCSKAVLFEAINFDGYNHLCIWRFNEKGSCIPFSNNALLKEALEELEGQGNALEWYRDAVPELTSEADYENRQKEQALIKRIKEAIDE